MVSAASDTPPGGPWGARAGGGTGAAGGPGPGSGASPQPDPAFRLYVADTGNNCIRCVDWEGTVVTVAGCGTGGFTDGVGSEARFAHPSGVAVDAHGYVYVADTDNHAVRRLSPDGTVITLAGNGTVGSADGMRGDARFSHPCGIAVRGRNRGEGVGWAAGCRWCQCPTPRPPVARLCSACEGVGARLCMQGALTPTLTSALGLLGRAGFGCGQRPTALCVSCVAFPAPPPSPPACLPSSPAMSPPD
jgi:hypothetical protein